MKMTKQECFDRYGIDADNLMKRDDLAYFSKSDDTPDRAMLFDEIMSRKDDDDDDITTDPADTKLSDKLNEICAALIAADPAVTRQQAVFFILHTAAGRALFQHFSKHKEQTMPLSKVEELKSIAKADGGMVMIAKAIIDKGSTTITEHEFSAALMEYAKGHRKSDESAVSAFSRMLGEDGEIRTAYGIVKGYPNMMDTEPVSTVVGSTVTADDSKKAYEQLVALAEKQRALAPTLTVAQLFARVFSDPANSALANAAHRRPNASSTSGSELQR